MLISYEGTMREVDLVRGDDESEAPHEKTTHT